jgi:hypothetical protein
MSEELKPCPFCGDGGFDLLGLKWHLQSHCEVSAALADSGHRSTVRTPDPKLTEESRFYCYKCKSHEAPCKCRAAESKLTEAIRAIGAMIPMDMGDGRLGSFENDPPDAIVDAVRRRLKFWEESVWELHKTRNEARTLIGGLRDVIRYLDADLFEDGDGFTLERAAIAKAEKFMEGK